MGQSCSQPPISILVVGCEHSGKTTFLYYLKEKKFQRVLPTIGFNIQDVTFNRKQYQITDLTERDLFKQMVNQTNNILYLIDPQGDNDDQEEYINDVLQYESSKHIEFAVNKTDLGKYDTNKFYEIYKIDQSKYKITNISSFNGLNISQLLDQFRITPKQSISQKSSLDSQEKK